MYSKIRTLSETLNLNRTAINLPRDGVLDALILRVQMKIHNGDTDPWVGTIFDLLKGLEEIRVISDGTVVHYSLSAQDVAVLNAYDGKYGDKAPLSSAVTIAADAVYNLDVPLILNEGDILAVAKDSLELRVNWNTSPITDLAVTESKIIVTETINIPTPEELIGMYGGGFEMAAEPKVYALSASVAASTELSPCLDLPTGTLLRRAILRTSGAPDSVGLIVTAPDRREMLSCDYVTLRAMQGYMYTVAGAPPANTAVLDYGASVAADGFGLRGWRYTKGDYVLAMKAAAPITLRYISCEHVVNTAHFEAAEYANIEHRPGL